MGDNVAGATQITALCVKEFGMKDKCIAQRASASQAALSAYGAGANGLAAAADVIALLASVVEIRDTLVANGMWKGSA